MLENIFGSLIKVEINPPFKGSGLAELSLLNEFVCHNQGKYIQFEYLLGLKHKEIRIELNKPDPNKDAIKELLNDFETYYETELKEVSQKNFELIIKYFEKDNRSKMPPRVCIKVASPEGDITDLYRNNRVSQTRKDHITTNTGFEHVKENGTFFLCQNIPENARKGTYKNPRLIDHFVRNYKPKYIDKIIRDKIDIIWCGCWNIDPDTEGYPNWEYSCYKSTLIVPMTLINNDLSESFKINFFKNNPSNNRTIWGFLCVDHPRINYFKKEKDVIFGYIFADIMSQYFISLFIHTGLSETYDKAISLIENN